MNGRDITIKDIEVIVPFSRGSTEINLTGQWSGRKPAWVEKTSPCRQACPVGNDIARAFSLAAKGKIDEALRVYRQDNPLPGVCGRVCYHPCEGDCNRRDLDRAVNIRGFERFLSDRGTVDVGREMAARKKKEKVAVVGSGPAGLSAAYHLARMGYPVTIFEALPQIGGMLRYGIPEYRLPRDVLQREISYIGQLGVDIRTGVRVGSQASIADIRRDYRAVFVGLGAHYGLQLGVEGEGLPGVMDGISFLRRINQGEKVRTGKRVAVIGGGNTAIDCARVAKRLGRKEVTIFYRRSRAEMPALEEDVLAAEAEGIRIELLAGPVRVVSENGRVSGIECIRMQLGAADTSGRAQPVPVPGSEFTVGADTIIAAVGQAPESSFLKELGLALDRRGMIETVAGTGATSMEGVFAGGDCAGGKAFVADAIAGGKRGAMAVSCYLEGKDVKKEAQAHRIGAGSSFSFLHFMGSADSIDLKSVVTYDRLNTICIPYGDRNDNPEQVKPKDRIKSFAEITGGLDPGAMEAEIGRCFKCGTCTQCDICFLICPDVSITKEKDGYGVKVNYCKGCSMCASTCPRNVIEINEGGAR